MHGNYYFKYKMVAKPGASCAYILRTAPKISMAPSKALRQTFKLITDLILFVTFSSLVPLLSSLVLSPSRPSPLVLRLSIIIFRLFTLNLFGSV
jgi:hypothetical protein